MCVCVCVKYRGSKYNDKKNVRRKYLNFEIDRFDVNVENIAQKLNFDLNACNFI